MITLTISEDQIERAKTLYSFEGLKGSITKGESNIFGAIGEIVVNDYFIKNGFKVDFNSTFDFDLKINDWKVDVKTKKTKYTPKMDYLCSISAYNTKQDCDFYFFCRVLESFEKCYLLGYKKKNEFFKLSQFNKKGELDVNGWDFKDDCYNLKIKNLNKFKIY